MLKPLFNPAHIAAGFTAVLVGYTSSVIIVIQAATAAGATPAQTESWLLALGLIMGISSIGYSWWYRTPVLMAWSTPGAAMLAGAAGGYSLAEATGAFILCGAMITLTGLIRPLTRLLERIPPQLGTAMLAAILLPFCLKPFMAMQENTVTAVLMFAVFLAARQWLPRYAMLVLLAAGLICSFWLAEGEAELPQLTLAVPALVVPEFHLPALINLALPLYIITMLSQNLPGMTMINSHGYDTPVRPVLAGTGVINMLAAPFGGFSINLAAISAAICMNPEVDADASRRYRAAVWAGIFYLIAGLFASLVVGLFLALPAVVSQVLAGCALLGTLLMCLQSAFQQPDTREPALFTFLMTLSGVSLAGVSPTLWGLLLGLVWLRVCSR